MMCKIGDLKERISFLCVKVMEDDTGNLQEKVVHEGPTMWALFEKPIWKWTGAFQRKQTILRPFLVRNGEKAKNLFNRYNAIRHGNKVLTILEVTLEEQTKNWLRGIAIESSKEFSYG